MKKNSLLIVALLSMATLFIQEKSLAAKYNPFYNPITNAKTEGEKPVVINASLNSIEDGAIALKFTNAKGGIYNLKLVTDFGQVVFRTVIYYSGSNAIQTVYTDKALAKGIYSLIVTAPDKTRTTIQIINQ